MPSRLSFVSLVLCVLSLSTAACGNSEPERAPDAPAATVSQTQKQAPEERAPQPTAVARPRRAIECARYLEVIGGDTAGGLGVAARPGRWGGLNEAFQELPDGAELCGAAFMVTEDGVVQDESGTLVNVYLRSPLDIAQLQAFYEPLATRAGCRAQDAGDEHSRQWSCPDDKGKVLTLMALPDYQIYGLSGLLP